MIYVIYPDEVMAPRLGLFIARDAGKLFAIHLVLGVRGFRKREFRSMGSRKPFLALPRYVMRAAWFPRATRREYPMAPMFEFWRGVEPA